MAARRSEALPLPAVTDSSVPVDPEVFHEVDGLFGPAHGTLRECIWKSMTSAMPADSSTLQWNSSGMA